ncbi:nitric oxide synthase oxygenase [Actinoplanes sp. LDG1-06]|uniref:Nitric oxide synthase oxygenase n=2 Tax=Paractinoplanes ovalisporus TaxID=2810368 RepID=A0ABS2AMC4_9ACTN|nr:nitric oxide synthase oxygenase [Actinoplanes ovalisporus]
MCETVVDKEQALEFLELYYGENGNLDGLELRKKAVVEAIERTGTYVHTKSELTFGARVAWRNADRCIGRLDWRSLTVRDLRRVTTADEIFSELVQHLSLAGQGSIRPMVSIFPPAVPGLPFANVWNDRLIGYAGYRRIENTLVGDPLHVEFTAAVHALGWQGKGENFDVLPLVVETPAEGVRLYELPERAIREVPVTHPEYGWFAELGLRWHAVPAISNMRLAIGGLHYPLAPFNGWFMGTEIGARILAADDRYDMLPVIASRLRLDTSRESTLWRDRALVELNRAVLWSFERAGVKISDHRSESQRFLAHIQNEERAGRSVPADWSWIVPPMSGSLTPVVHGGSEATDIGPAFYLDEEGRRLAAMGRQSLDEDSISKIGSSGSDLYVHDRCERSWHR